MLFDDSDIKIAGDFSKKQSQSIVDAPGDNILNEDSEKARCLGKALAESFFDAIKNTFSDEEESDPQMLIQRQILLSFTISVTLDEFCKNDTIAGIAEKSFLDTVNKQSIEVGANCEDTGAFSFYYLAYRRKIEVDRRIGQTFAMLCSHDGDSIYQELGEALFCWFSSVVKSAIDGTGLSK